MLGRLLLIIIIVGGVQIPLWLLQWPWWLNLGIALISLVVALVWLKPFVARSKLLDRNIDFVTCPACGTRNPRHSHPRYECYNCGRSFSELSGRHPTLPSRIAGV